MEDDLIRLLGSTPQPRGVVDELFDRARDASESRLFLAIADLERWTDDGQKLLACLPMRHWVIQQFAEYFRMVDLPIGNLPDPAMENLFRRLQMLAYSQFWECRGIQRLLMQLVRIVKGEPYDPRLLIDNRPAASSIYKSLIFGAGQLGLALSKFIAATYQGQIRNAFAHSEFCVLAGRIILFNHDARNENHIPSLGLQTWDTLYGITSEFIKAFFGTRLAYERDLKARAPYRVQLSEFACSFVLYCDAKGYWGARRV
jgi:hypothetical protein